MAEVNLTKNTLAASMKHLMSEKPFAKISITDICDGCGMNRKSFYYHFKDKYDLMNWIFYTDFVSLVSDGGYQSGWELIEALCLMFYQDKEFYKSALKTEGQNSFREYFKESAMPVLSILFEDMCEDPAVGEIISRLICECFLAALNEWVSQDCPVEPAQYLRSIKKLLLKVAEGISQDEN